MKKRKIKKIIKIKLKISKICSRKTKIMFKENSMKKIITKINKINKKANLRIIQTKLRDKKEFSNNKMKQKEIKAKIIIIINNKYNNNNLYIVQCNLKNKIKNKILLILKIVKVTILLKVKISKFQSQNLILLHFFREKSKKLWKKYRKLLINQQNYKINLNITIICRNHKENTSLKNRFLNF